MCQSKAGLGRGLHIAYFRTLKVQKFAFSKSGTPPSPPLALINHFQNIKINDVSFDCLKDIATDYLTVKLPHFSIFSELREQLKF